VSESKLEKLELTKKCPLFSISPFFKSISPYNISGLRPKGSPYNSNYLKLVSF
jgi:hypothetical protein